jgi:hypothetical protein
MNYFIPVRDKTRNFPILSAHDLSEDYELNNIDNKTTTFFFEEASPSPKGLVKDNFDTMVLHNHLICNDLLKEYLLRSSPKLPYERAIFIDKNGTYHEDYWIFRPTSKISNISLENSEYKEVIIDKDEPDLNLYKFRKIVTDPNIHIEDSIYFEKYLTSLAINEDTLSFIIENQLKGLSFLKVEDYSLGKTTRFTPDQIVV